MTRVTLIGKPDCHLCNEAREQVSRVCDELSIGWQELSILEDPGLYDEYWEKIPVVLIDGRIHDFWRVDPRRLRRALSDNRSDSSD
jgi:Glutaredoxin-like domain (DUF836)